MSLNGFPNQYRSPEHGDTTPEPMSRTESTRQSARYLIEELDTLEGFTSYTDITAMYKMLPPDELVVRRENPETLLESLENDHPVEIKFDGGTPYANAVSWKHEVDGTHGLDNAFLEGQAHLNNVVMVYGFKKPEGLYYEKTPAREVYDGIDRSHVRSAAGFVPTDAIRFVTVRVPLSGFPEAMMTEDEKERLFDYNEQDQRQRKPSFIFRGYLKV